MKTDEEYVNTIKRQYLKRKKYALILFFMAILFAAISYVVHEKTQQKTLSLLESFQFQRVGDVISEEDLKSIKTINELALAIGNKIGFFTGTMILTIGALIGQALGLLITGRKDRLLIKYYEQSRT